MIKFEDYTIGEASIWKYGYEISLKKDDEIMFVVFGEFNGHVEVEVSKGDYHTPDYEDAQAFVELDLESIDIQDWKKGEELTQAPSKFLLDLIETAISEHMIESGDEYEYSYDPHDYYED
jgi:hypothetical protein